MSKSSRTKGAACECGCGRPTSLATQTDTKRGYRRGEPMRFLPGHGGHEKLVKPLDSLYVTEERGFATPCWIWQGGNNDSGYGRTRNPTTGRMWPAHVAMWHRHNGPVPEGLQLDHLCFQPACVNPAHLEPVTPRENQRRKRSVKLTDADIAAIRQARTVALATNPTTATGSPRMRVHGGRALRERLAEEYGITADYVKTIWRGDVWAAA